MTDTDDLTELLTVLYQGLRLICAGLEKLIARRKARQAARGQ